MRPGLKSRFELVQVVSFRQVWKLGVMDTQAGKETERRLQNAQTETWIAATRNAHSK